MRRRRWTAPRRLARGAWALALGGSLATAVIVGGWLGGRDAAPGVPKAESTPVRGRLGVFWESRDLPAAEPFLTAMRGTPTYRAVDWCTVETSPGRYRWESADRTIDPALRLGFQVYLRIRTGRCHGAKSAEPRPSDADAARRPWAGPSGFPRDEAAYRAFVSAVATRYSARGVTTYAVENEVNAANFWSGTSEEYSRLVRIAVPAIHAVVPTAVVADSGIASPAYGVAIAADLLAEGRAADALAFYNAYYVRRLGRAGTVERAARNTAELEAVLASERSRRHIEFLNATFDLARAGAVDAYQLHYYEPVGTLAQTLDYIRARNGGRPIDAWETGVYWPDPGYDADEHARGIAPFYRALFDGGVRSAIYLPLIWRPWTVERPRGLFDQQGVPRPAATALAAVAGVR